MGRHFDHRQRPDCPSLAVTAIGRLPNGVLSAAGRLDYAPPWWFVHRDEFNSLLAPDVTLPCRAARQHFLIRNLQQLAAMLWQHEAEATLRVLLHDLRRAIMFRKGGACCEDAEGMVWHRAEWRIRDGIVDSDQTEEALRLVQAIIELGMVLLRNIDWRHSRLVSMIAAQTGIDLGL